MPKWLRIELQKAFESKNISKVKTLNETWFFYSAVAK